MKISARFMKNISGFVFMLILLTPVTVLAQTKVVVIPLFGDDAKPLKNIITVAKGNGDFTDPVAAVNSISDASADNPYLVVIGPGIYTLTRTLVMKEYVDITGSGENVTKLQGTISTESCDASSSIISGANNATLSSLTIENTGGGNCSYALYNYNASPSVRNVTGIASGANNNYAVYNFLFSSPTIRNVTAIASGGSFAGGVVNVNSSSPTMTNVTATASGGAVSNRGVNNHSSSPVMTNITATASGGDSSCGVRNYTSSPMMSNVTATASGAAGNNGVDNSSSSSPVMSNVTATASGGTFSYGIFNSSSSPTMTNVTAIASGGIQSCGIYIGSGSAVIRRTTMEGVDSGLFANIFSQGTVAQSTIIGGATGGGNMTCVACDDGNGAALNADCTTP